LYYLIAGQFAMSHGSYDSNLGSEILILGGDIRSRSWPNIGDSYGTYPEKEYVQKGWPSPVSLVRATWIFSKEHERKIDLSLAIGHDPIYLFWDAHGQAR
jgi:hypothetical protein